MALNNIRPYTAIGSGGGHLSVQWYQLAAATLVAGEPFVFSSGQAAECADDPAVVSGFVMATPADGFAGTALNYPFVNGLNPDRALAAGDSAPCILAGPSQRYITGVLLSNGTAFNTAPVMATHVGAKASLDLISGVWGLRPGGGSNQHFLIEAVLDAQGRELGLSFTSPAPGAGVYTVFRQISGFTA